jgi:predicted ATPase
MDEINRGSEWRKWDLHFHTPTSYDYQDKSVTNQDIIDGLLANNIAVVAITDHHVIDIARIQELQKLGKEKGITVLPGIEFLAELRDKEPIHYIGIFSEEANLDIIWGQLENKTALLGIKSESKKHNEVYCVLKDTVELIKELGGIVTIHSGSKTNSVENITNSLRHSIAQKTDIAKLVDFYELGKPEDKTGYLEIVFPAIKQHIPMIIASDNHNIKKYTLKENCWIKADKTFQGLKQVIYEPKERVRIQANKPQEKAGYQAIDCILITHSDFAPNKININQNLNTIIGGRSTGKSILLGAIAKKLNSDKEVKFENEDYTNYVNQIVSNLKVFWKDGIENNDRNIEYFPQSYMHRLAKNLNNDLDKLIEEIITQDEAKRNEIDNYDNFSKNNNTDIVGKINKLFQTSSDFQKLKLSIKELGDEAGINSEKSKLTATLEDLRSKIKITEEDLNTYKSLVQQYNENQNLISGIENQILKLNSLKEKSVSNDGLEFDFVNLIEPTKTAVFDIYKDLKTQFQKTWTTKLSDLILSIQQEVTQLNLSNSQIVENPIYTKGTSVFSSNQQYKEIEEKLKIQTNKIFEIGTLKAQEKALIEQYSLIKEAIKFDFREYFNRIISIKDKLSLKSDKLEIKAKATLSISRYREYLNSSINQQGYQGQEIVNKQINTYEDFFTAVFELFEQLLSNKVTLKGGNTNITLSQKILATNFFKISYDIIYEDIFKHMSEGKKAFVVLMLLLDFSNKDCPILIDQPEDDLDNRAIYNELVAYIKKKKKERQIIVVTHNPNIVVGADSELVIVSNQHGVNSPNKRDFKFDYVHGSLEMTKEKDESVKETLFSQGIRQHVCEILEGGFEAFKKRELKYDIQ